MGTSTAIAVQRVDDGGRRDDVIDELTDLINRVYTVAEAGLWREGVTRTTTAEVADLVGAGEIAVATRADRIVGTVRFRDLAPDMSEFGMLATDPAHRGAGVGRALVDFAEQSSSARGRRAMRLELLVPHSGRHEGKDLLQKWYGRCGYRLIGAAGLESTHPHLTPLLATPCDFEVYEKRLTANQG